MFVNVYRWKQNTNGWPIQTIHSTFILTLYICSLTAFVSTFVCMWLTRVHRILFNLYSYCIHSTQSTDSYDLFCSLFGFLSFSPSIISLSPVHLAFVSPLLSFPLPIDMRTKDVFTYFSLIPVFHPYWNSFRPLEYHIHLFCIYRAVSTARFSYVYVIVCWAINSMKIFGNIAHLTEGHKIWFEIQQRIEMGTNYFALPFD